MLIKCYWYLACFLNIATFKCYILFAVERLGGLGAKASRAQYRHGPLDVMHTALHADTYFVFLEASAPCDGSRREVPDHLQSVHAWMSSR